MVEFVHKGVRILYCQNEKQQPSDWLHTTQLVQNWLSDRKDLLVLYTQVSSSDPVAEPECTVEAVHAFCQTLIDYVSRGHFKIFETLSEMIEKYHPKLKGLDPKILNQIRNTTSVIVDFNDKYTQPKHLDGLRNDLSKLGEHLAHRLDWEDELIQMYQQTSMHLA